MMSTRLKRLLRAGVVAGCITALGCTCTLVYAGPSKEELKEKTNGLETELNSLGNELDSLSGEMEDISKEIKDTSVAMKKTQKEMDKAQEDGKEQYEAMKLRIKYIYEAGDASLFSLLSSSADMTDFLNKADFIQNVSEYDRNMLQELEDIQNKIKKQGDTLKKQQESLEEMGKKLQSKHEQLESKISSKSGELGNYKTLLAQVEEAERLAAVKQAQERAAAEAAAKVQAANTNTAKKDSKTSDSAKQETVETGATPDNSTSNSGNGQSSGQTSDTAAPPADNSSSSSGSSGQSLGSFRITHYCNCYYCCGQWAGGATASGTIPTAGRTIATDPSVIPLGSRVIINGHVYVAEDTGSAIIGNRIDVYVNSHSTALAMGTYFAEVYLAN